ncbi:DUF202 domain-containing protein [Jiangella ureilytica]|uniref:DUF202 domain-containing protein n=1 Tax=Jiangella ureilytica TaxID=2530374 RepID=A0A4R4RC95_9ACTN|nr:DUF202 domain-containing protein [Jiangella ureilytica]TDC46013.1 DUF202 domain-containing protein [Jiangella ureilytica]
MNEPFDPGLQPERTLLAWRRTCLALAVATAVAVRLLAETVGPAAVIAGLAGLALNAVAYVSVAGRYRRVHLGLTRSGALAVGGRSLALMTVTVLLVGVACAGYVAGRAWPT